MELSIDQTKQFTVVQSEKNRIPIQENSIDLEQMKMMRDDVKLQTIICFPKDDEEGNGKKYTAVIGRFHLPTGDTPEDRKEEGRGGIG
jgi:hypothetical protein